MFYETTDSGLINNGKSNRSNRITRLRLTFGDIPMILWAIPYPFRSLESSISTNMAVPNTTTNLNSQEGNDYKKTSL